MGPDAANIVGSLAKSLEVDRSPGVTQRASEITQSQLAEESAAAFGQVKTSALEHARQEKIRRDRERRRRENERSAPGHFSGDITGDDGQPHLDVVV